MAERLRDLDSYQDPTARVSPHAVIEGPVYIGPRTIIDHFAILQGPVWIGANCIIGSLAKVRGPAHIADGSRIGAATELKNTLLEGAVSVGPLCFVCDSVVEEGAFLGALVRTSNFNLDYSTVSVDVGNKNFVDTGLTHLGAHIGARAALGISVVIFPGRIVPGDSLFGPKVNIEKNLPPGRYTLRQELNYTPPSQE
jgi:bifunctional UDP-N-acetylglucosamine pyrophosphorylase/glucosamine-1-phosphate N-acetyltransferase